MPATRKRYDREFCEGAVQIVEETGKSIAAVARLGSTKAPWQLGGQGPGGPRLNAATAGTAPRMDSTEGARVWTGHGVLTHPIKISILAA
jgi:hypothetical protein